MGSHEDFNINEGGQAKKGKNTNALNVLLGHYVNPDNPSSVSMADKNALIYAPEIMEDAVKNDVKSEYNAIKADVEKIVKEITP